MEGFTVNLRTPAPTCMKHTEVKQTVKPFSSVKQSAKKKKGPTHLHGPMGQRRRRLQKCQGRDEIRSRGTTHACSPGSDKHHALRIDRGTEFVNWDLQSLIQTKRNGNRKDIAILTFTEWRNGAYKPNARLLVRC